MFDDKLFVVVVFLFLVIIGLSIIALVLVFKSSNIVHCPKCKYYYAPVCTFYKQLPMTSRKGFCYHGKEGEYKGDTPTISYDESR